VKETDKIKSKLLFPAVAVLASSPPALYAGNGYGQAAVNGPISGTIQAALNQRQPQTVVVEKRIAVHDRTVVHDQNAEKPAKKAVYPVVHVFRVGDTEVHLVFKGNPPADVVVVASYLNIKTKTFSDREIQTMLDKNSDGPAWGSPGVFRDEGNKINYTIWDATKHDDWTIPAIYNATGPNAGVLLVETKAEYFLGQQADENNGI
jgi:hypothetical protein